MASITFDGARSNIATARILGASLDPTNLQPFFFHPTTGQKIVIILDICHMLKLVRNTMMSLGLIINGDGKSIMWKYIALLENVQSSQGVLLANKLRSKHINFLNIKMKTSVAAQTLSNSVASALQSQLNLKNPDFAKSEATIEFILYINNLFDIFNSKRKTNIRFKRPICIETISEYHAYFEKAEKYIRELKIIENGKHKILIHSKSCTGYLGFLTAIQSFKILYNELIETKYMSYLLGYKFSQDHIETFFSAVRSRGGFNNNPTCAQFSAAYTKLLLKNEIAASLHANAADSNQLNILSANSTSVVKVFKDNETNIYKKALENNEDYDIGLANIDPIVHDATTYIAGYVERSLRKKIQCNLCLAEIDKLDACNSINLIQAKDWGGLTKPKKDIVKICQLAEREIGLIKSEGISKANIHAKIMVNTFRSINRDIFREFDCNLNHILKCELDRYSIIKICIDTFTKIKLCHLAKCENEKLQKNLIRQKFNKLVLFKGQ